MDETNALIVCHNSTIVRYYDSFVYADDSIVNKSDKMIFAIGQLLAIKASGNNYREDHKWLFNL